MNRTRLGVFALCCAPLLAQQPAPVEATVKVADPSNRTAPPPVMPVSESMPLSQKAPAGLTTWTECTDPWFGVLDCQGKKVAVVVGKSKADAALPDLLGVDLDADGKIAKNEQLALEVTVTEGRATAAGRGPSMQRSKPVDVEFAIGGTKMPAKVGFARAGDAAPSATIAFPSYLEATVKIGDGERIVAIVDKDLDGKFGTAGDLWALTKTDAKQPASLYVMNTLGERAFDDGKLIALKVTGKTVQVTTSEAKGPDPKDAAMHRQRVEHIWSDRFDKEREEFVKARGMDTARPLAKTPIQWHYVTFDEGLALAKKAGKPLFVDVMAFWCVWCYRMDYYTYPDQEVADLMNKSFVPVKIIEEQSVGDDYAVTKGKLEAKGIPAMGIFDADGKLLHKIGGWLAPSGEKSFVTELKAGLEKAGTK